MCIHFAILEFQQKKSIAKWETNLDFIIFVKNNEL